MVERQCEHCTALNLSVVNEDSKDDLSLSHDTKRNPNIFPEDNESNSSLYAGTSPPEAYKGGSAAARKDRLEKTSHAPKDEEKGGDSSKPSPVGVFHGSLNKLRLEAFGLWVRTGRQSLRHAVRIKTDFRNSTDSMRLHPHRPFHVLGRSLPR